MFNIRKHLRHVVLAVGLGAASLSAVAGVLPTYKISGADVTTSDIAFIDIQFVSFTGAAPVTASLSHFSGVSLADAESMGAVSATAGGFAIDNAPTLNDLYLAVTGPFAFDLNFTDGFLGIDSSFFSNSTFSIALYDSDSNVIGDPSGALNFSLAPTGVDVISTTSLLSLTQATAAAVPEPTDWALMLTGLVLVVAMTRLNGRANPRSLGAA